ncbi:MAG TPA: helix-turn-helix domain-containing protein [Candidatus Aphodovivens avistercoris]|nr:helix-turn-helix domain-containing protein [Candidatus Aphodovivens avistercoris]
MQGENLPLILNTGMLSSLLNVSEQTVRKECALGHIPAVKVGRRWFVPRDRFIEFLNGGMKLGA